MKSLLEIIENTIIMKPMTKNVLSFLEGAFFVEDSVLIEERRENRICRMRTHIVTL